MATNDYIKDPKTGKLAGSKAGAHNLPKPVAELMPHSQVIPDDYGRPEDALDRMVVQYNRKIISGAGEDYKVGEIIVARFNHPVGGDKRNRYQKIERNNGNEYDLACWMNLDNKLTYRLDELAEVELVPEDALDRAVEQRNLRVAWKAQNPDAGDLNDFEVTAHEGAAAEGEHGNYRCGTCGSNWIRYEHLDGKDCDENCADPCLIRICNEEDCIGEAVLVDTLVIKSVRQLGRTCHDCSCDVSAPCEACVSCLVCNEESNRAACVQGLDRAYDALYSAIMSGQRDLKELEDAYKVAHDGLEKFDESMAANHKEVGLDQSEKKED